MRKLLITATFATLPTFAFGQSFNVVGPDGKPDALASYAGTDTGIPVQTSSGTYGWVEMGDLISPPNLDNDPSAELQTVTDNGDGTCTLSKGGGTFPCQPEDDDSALAAAVANAQADIDDLAATPGLISDPTDGSYDPIVSTPDANGAQTLTFPGGAEWTHTPSCTGDDTFSIKAPQVNAVSIVFDSDTALGTVITEFPPINVPGGNVPFSGMLDVQTAYSVQGADGTLYQYLTRPQYALSPAGPWVNISDNGVDAIQGDGNMGEVFHQDRQLVTIPTSGASIYVRTILVNSTTDGPETVNAASQTASFEYVTCA